VTIFGRSLGGARKTYFKFCYEKVISLTDGQRRKWTQLAAFKLNLTSGDITTFHKVVFTFIAKVHTTFFLKPTNSQPTSGIFKYKISKQENCIRVTIWYFSLCVHF